MFVLAFLATVGTQDPIVGTQDSVTVTASRTATRLADTPSSVVILGRHALATNASITLDDALRQVPGFTLFRRSSSTTANPTTQGVSLRGIGASGASTRDSSKRTLQVPRSQATLQLAFRSLAGVQTRWSSMQFDDDLNQFPLRGYFVADLFVAHPIAAGLEATLAVDNVFNRRIETAATPVINLAQPRAARVGIRYGFH